jgi:hypothetical protein
MTGSHVNFLPTTILKRFKYNENIPKYSFKFMSTDMLSTRINVDTYLPGKTLLTLKFLQFHSFYDHLIIINIMFYRFYRSYNTCWTRRKKDKFRIYQNLWYFTLDWLILLFLVDSSYKTFNSYMHATKLSLNLKYLPQCPSK